jgi:hypothetical protein
MPALPASPTAARCHAPQMSPLAWPRERTQDLTEEGMGQMHGLGLLWGQVLGRQVQVQALGLELELGSPVLGPRPTWEARG